MHHMDHPGLTVRTIVGMEIHVQLATRSKLFCGCAVEFGASPNSRVCPVCLGLPGVLPVMNRQALELAVRMGLALDCRIASFTKWDRKSYYYPDLPKNYQISQYDLPLCVDGVFELPLPAEPDGGAAWPSQRGHGTRSGRTHGSESRGTHPHRSQGNGKRRVRIVRAHLEEDAGKNIHDTPGCTLVDLNRAGTPLLEIVTYPDLESADEAFSFAVELQRLAVYLGVSEGSMQKGQMRFEPNVNLAITRDGVEYRTPICEIKNLNSFKAVRSAIAYEEQRQLQDWLADPDYVHKRRPNENRGWNDQRGVTELQRGKEDAPDYRYFPDPDLVPVALEAEWLEGIRASLPELPQARCERLVAVLGVTPVDAETLVADRATADLLDEALAAGGDARLLCNLFLGPARKLANESGRSIADLPVDASSWAALSQAVQAGQLSSSAAAQALTVAVASLDAGVGRGDSREDLPDVPAAGPDEAGRFRVDWLALAERLGILQERDAGAVERWVDEAVAANEQAVQTILTNPKKAKASEGFLRGQVMRLSGGKADPKLAGELIARKIAEIRSRSALP